MKRMLFLFISLFLFPGISLLAQTPVCTPIVSNSQTFEVNEPTTHRITLSTAVIPSATPSPTPYAVCTPIGSEFTVIVSDPLGEPITGGVVEHYSSMTGELNAYGEFRGHNPIYKCHVVPKPITITVPGYEPYTQEIRSGYYYITLTPLTIETPGPGAFHFGKHKYTAPDHSFLETRIYLNSGSQNVGAFNFDLEFGSSFLWAEDITSPADGFIIISNKLSNDTFSISAIDPTGKGPSSQLEILTINWETRNGEASTFLRIKVNELVNASNETIGEPKGIASTVVIVPPGILGDVNNDGLVNILDALQVAQYSVGLKVPGFRDDLANVNKDEIINIVDALLIAQYSVGLITSLETL